MMLSSEHIRIPRYGVLLADATDEQARLWHLFERNGVEWLLPPIAGADGEGDGDGDGGGSGDGAGDGDGNSDANANANANGDGDGNDDNDDDDNSAEDVLEIRRGDYERLRQISRQHEAAEKQRQKEEEARKRKEAIEAGRFDDAMREEAEKTASAERERDEARAELATVLRRHRVEGVAKRLGFKDPEDALLYITDEEGDDDAASERALKRVIKKKPYLIDTRRGSGMPLGGGGSGSILTIEQIQSMSEDEINENWAEVQKVLAANGS